MKIVMSSGHGKYIRGAADILDEVNEARRVVERVAEKLRKSAVDVVTFHDDVSSSQNENLERIVSFHNTQGPRDLDVSVHFNAYEHTADAMGTECLHVAQETIAASVSAAIAAATELPDRGAKYRGDLYFLNNTDEAAILIETVFVDSAADATAYTYNFDAICDGIATALLNLDIDYAPPEPEPEPPEPPPYTGDNRIEIVGAVHGDVAVSINGHIVHAPDARVSNAVTLNVNMQGDVTLVLNGQEFHNKTDATPPNQTEIIATVFGGESDYNVSAYDEDKVLNDVDLYVALPDRFEGERPMVRVVNRATGMFAEASIEDVGPWNTDDPYWETCTRPQAETGFDEKGRATNGAGIDLSPALAAALGIDGKGKVDWDFVY